MYSYESLTNLSASTAFTISWSLLSRKTKSIFGRDWRIYSNKAKELIFVVVFLSGGSLAVPVFWWFLLIHHTVPCCEQWQKNNILHKHQNHHDDINSQKLFYSWTVRERRRKSSKFWLLGWICFSNIWLTPPGICRLMRSYHVLNSQRSQRSCNILIHRLLYSILPKGRVWLDYYSNGMLELLPAQRRRNFQRNLPGINSDSILCSIDFVLSIQSCVVEASQVSGKGSLLFL